MTDLRAMMHRHWRSVAGLLLLVLAVQGAADWWREHQAGQLAGQIARQARPGDIELLSSTTCVFCERARRWLTQHQVPFSECFIERDDACAARYQALGARGTPTLVVRGQPQLGFSPEQVLNRLQRSPGA